MSISAPTQLATWSANCRFIASPFPASGRARPRPSNASSMPSSPSALKTNLRRWNSSASIDPSPRTNSHSNKALAESSSASAPSTLANLSPSPPPLPAPRPAASSLFVRAGPLGSPAASLPFPHVYLPSLSPLPPAAAVPLGWFRAHPTRCANNAETTAARSSVLASARKDPDIAPPASGSPHTKSLPAPAPDPAIAKLIATAPSLPAPLARLSTPRSPPAASAPGFRVPPLAAPAGSGCPAQGADAQSLRARSPVFLLSPPEGDLSFARTEPDPAACSPRWPATIHGSPPTQMDAPPPPCHTRIPPRSPLPTLSASSSGDSHVSPATRSSPAAPDPSCRDTYTLHRNRLRPI